MTNAVPPPSISSRQRWLKSLAALVRALAAVVCVIAFFAIVDFALHGSNANFWSVSNLQNISVQNAFIAIAALGMLLIMIAGGIDLSAGMALALCSTIVAWGIREDIGFLIAHGENVASAARRLKAADETWHTAAHQTDAPRTEQLQAEVDQQRQHLAELLQIKLDQLQSRIARHRRRRQFGD